MSRLNLIIDLEATCWEKDPEQREKSEVIEIGALLFDPAERRVLEEFQTFVRPTRHPVLSEFCTKLTTIRQSQVDAAPGFPQALERLLSTLVRDRSVLLASWGDYDREQLRKECKRHSIRWPFGKKHLNLKDTFAKWKGRRPCGLAEAMAVLGMTFEGTPHRGIDDVRQIARVYSQMLKRA